MTPLHATKKGTPVIVTVYETLYKGIISRRHHPTGFYYVEIRIGRNKYELLREHDDITIDKQATLKNYFQ